MCSDSSPSKQTAVVKIGGSILTGPSAYGAVARLLADRITARPTERILAVVSAEEGTTDRLLRSARDIVSNPDPDTLNLLWSTGELRSVALLVFALHARGVRAVAANVHQTGLVSAGLDGASGGRLRWRNNWLRPLRLRALLASADVVVVPGFLARGRGDGVTTLGRGGSDLSAVLLAAGLEASRCELLKDVPGYFSADPHVVPDAVAFERLPYGTAIDMARQGCGVVQLQALEAARDLGVRLFVRDVSGAGTVIET